MTRPVDWARPGALGLLIVAGCGSQIPALETWADQSVGRPVAELEALDAKPTSYAARSGTPPRLEPAPGGGSVYVHPDRPGCEIRFAVDAAGLVTGWTTAGDGCEER